jgi:hypothetical protein
MNKKLLLFLMLSCALCLSVKAQTFSSVYTDLNKDCRNKFKSVGEGQDMPLVCKGFGGYQIHIDYSASSEHYRAEKGQSVIGLVRHRIGRVPSKKIEWRMANGKPFAIIVRINKYDEDSDEFNPKKIGQSLLIKGLAGYEHIDFEVDAALPNANAKAQKMADSNRVN